MYKKALLAGAVFAGLAVISGAFAAHGLQRITQDPQLIENFKTASSYQMYHALAILITAVLLKNSKSILLNTAVYLFVSGIVLFSCSLFLISYLKIRNIQIPGYVTLITPIGGLCFISGWFFLILSLFKQNSVH
ncbi:MAG: DUF423 domain-containing protein [Chitinophagaceae bacterium]|nr:DUF423 domain-containing protein [Chitinophagaceae bacterium]